MILWCQKERRKKEIMRNERGQLRKKIDERKKVTFLPFYSNRTANENLFNSFIADLLLRNYKC